MKQILIVAKVILFFCIFYVSLLIFDRFYFYATDHFSKKAILEIDTPKNPSPPNDNLNVVADNELSSFISYAQNLQNIKGNYAVFPKEKTERQVADIFEENVTLETDLNNLIYKVKYTTDHHGRRLHPLNDLSGKMYDTAVVVIGCSFSFGHGVQDNETFSYYLNSWNKKIQVWNFSARGSSPADILYNMDEDSEKYKIPAKKIILVYGNILEHFYRNSCNSKCFQDNQNWVTHRAKYSLFFNEVYLNPFINWAYNNSVLKTLALNFKFISEANSPISFPSLDSKSDGKLLNAILDKIYTNFAKNYEVIDSYKIYLDSFSQNTSEALINSTNIYDHYKPVSIPYIKISHQLKFNPQLYTIPFDLHPTPLHHFITAKYLNYQIKKDHPDLFYKQ